MRCEQVVDDLSEVALGAGVLDVATRRHVEQCLRCQAEVVQYRKLLRALQSLRTDVLEPAPGFLPDLLASLEYAGEKRAVRGIVTGRRLAYVGGLAAATAAGAAGYVLASRTRRSRAALAS